MMIVYKNFLSYGLLFLVGLVALTPSWYSNNNKSLLFVDSYSRSRTSYTSRNGYRPSSPTPPSSPNYYTPSQPSYPSPSTTNSNRQQPSYLSYDYDYDSSTTGGRRPSTSSESSNSYSHQHYYFWHRKRHQTSSGRNCTNAGAAGNVESKGYNDDCNSSAWLPILFFISLVAGMFFCFARGKQTSKKTDPKGDGLLS